MGTFVIFCYGLVVGWVGMGIVAKILCDHLRHQRDVYKRALERHNLCHDLHYDPKDGSVSAEQFAAGCESFQRGLFGGRAPHADRCRELQGRLAEYERQATFKARSDRTMWD